MRAVFKLGKKTGFSPGPFPQLTLSLQFFQDRPNADFARVGETVHLGDVLFLVEELRHLETTGVGKIETFVPDFGKIAGFSREFRD